jgi:hypothetical protein
MDSGDQRRPAFEAQRCSSSYPTVFQPRGDLVGVEVDKPPDLDPTWDAAERSDVADYLRTGASGDTSVGRHAGSANAATAVPRIHRRSVRLPQGLVHYLAEHDVRLPRTVVDAVLVRRRELEEADADRDTHWWRMAALGEGSD